ncbi:uncharacterized protein [Montipora capricornis]|uniref:uncharacterized protein n=1 Tax=Montipora capricornis TaxID=246305 RepID=UPI0035F18157
MKHAIPPVLATSPSGVPRKKAKPGTSHLHPTSPEFYYRAVPNEIKTESKEEANSSQRSDEELLKKIFKVQYEQLQSMISSQKQLATAVTLPQPEVPKFSGDPTKYQTFIIAFDARIQGSVANDADRLYYLDQHLTGEPKDLIGGCLHLEPDVGYKEARRLLDKEYGDPYKVSNAFIQRLSNWPVVKYDGPSLKRFSFFLTKCNNVMKAITHMTVLNHPPNMQSVVQNLPNNLQAKWRENVVKCRLKNGRIVGFEDLGKFVGFAAESANDPIYSKDALANTRAKPAPASGVDDHYKKLQTPKPTSTSFATNVDASTQSPSLHGTGSSRRDAVVPRATETKGVRCLLCHESHDIEECEGFKRKSVGERKTFLTEQSLCFGCYRQNHFSRQCRRKRVCKRCKGPQPTLLHKEGFARRKEPERGNRQSTVSTNVPQRKSENKELDIGLLIRSNCPSALVPLKVVPNEGHGPLAVRLRHGWTVSGPLHIVTAPITNKITVREIENLKEIITPESLLQLFELDFNERASSNFPKDLSYSQEDRKFLAKVSDGIKHTGGHYEIPLPFRKSEVKLPNNRQQALKRALWQRKMLQNQQYRSDYVAFITDMIGKGYAERVPSESLKIIPDKIWYIPHHGVYHPKKPKKIRVVFDCSARYGGTSLNDRLLQGPDMTNSLVGVLTRFRQEPVAFMADIEAMFYQVLVPADQLDFLRFLWWPNGDLSAELEEYRMRVHPFGVVSWPAVLITPCTPQPTKPNENTEVKLQKYCINELLVYSGASNPTPFKFCITVKDKPVTRRGILSTVSSIYDPLGFPAPFTLTAKKLLQDLCREEKISWDDELPDTYHRRWEEWLKELPLLERLSVPRCVKPVDFGEVKSWQIHIFSDASNVGYGSVAYATMKVAHTVPF